MAVTTSSTSDGRTGSVASDVASGPPARARAIRETLTAIARELLAELGGGIIDPAAVGMDSTLDLSLALDSLARMELFMRVERRFEVRLPEQLFESAQTLEDIARAIETSSAAIRTFARPGDARTAVPAPCPADTKLAFPPINLSLDQILRWHLDRHSEAPHLTILSASGNETITYEQLWSDAGAVADALGSHGVEIGDRVALMLPTSRDYFCTFFGVLMAGAIPVPLYPPVRPEQIEDHVRRHAGILSNAGARLLVTTRAMHSLARTMRAHAPTVRKILPADELRMQGRKQSTRIVVNPNATALLQYTSGSTGQPKGVTLTHRNILANIVALGTALRVRSDDVFVSWLPLYHDMGLIGAWLGTLFFGIPLVVMSPLTFLSRPVRWLEALHQYRGTLSAAPNFAYELCLKRIADEEIQTLDLSRWRIAMNGAEAVVPDTLSRFQDRFACCGFAATAMTPVYGLAECSVGLTVPPLDRGPLIDSIDRESFMRDGIAQPVDAASAQAMRFASCGNPLPGHQVRIVDTNGNVLPERRDGRLEFRGPSATRGYFNNEQATQALLDDGWLDSGDRAYIARGEVYVTGRIKDIIIRAGRHIYPEELEAGIGQLAGIRKGCVAVLGCKDEQHATERLVVIAETRTTETALRERLKRNIVELVVNHIGEPPDDIVLAQPHTVLKTSSGKIRRAATRQWYEAGGHAPRVGMQLLRLRASGATGALRRHLRGALDLAYGVYCWALFIPISAMTISLVMLPFGSDRCWQIMHGSARLLVRLCRLTVQIDGEKHLRAPERCIVVANHSSYLDSLVLAYALPKPCSFVAKHELASIPVIGRFLRRLGTQFVERFDVRTSVEDTRRLSGLPAGRPLIFFPEGTFVCKPGLLPFHLGAFSVAATAGRPVLSIALTGTRTLLPDKHWLPRRTKVALMVAAPMFPESSGGFHAAVLLRDEARSWIADRCAERSVRQACSALRTATEALRSTSDSQ